MPASAKRGAAEVRRVRAQMDEATVESVSLAPDQSAAALPCDSPPALSQFT